MKKYNFTVNETYDNKIIKDFLKSLGLSDRLLFKVKFGGIFVNGKNVFLDYRVKNGEQIEIIMPKDEPNEYIEPRFVPLKIIYEDNYLIAVHKPSGMLTHNTFGGNHSLENALAGYFYPTPYVFRGVNRLDKDTSGIVIVAKDSLIASILSEQIKKGDFKKYYKAIVCNTPPSKHGIIEQPIKKESDISIKRIIDSSGKQSKTEYFLEKTLSNNLSILSYILHTGRTHQIRVHSAFIGCPLYADKLYGQEIEGKTFCLCAYKLELTHPISKQRLILTTDLDENLL